MRLKWKNGPFQKWAGKHPIHVAPPTRASPHHLQSAFSLLLQTGTTTNVLDSLYNSSIGGLCWMSVRCSGLSLSPKVP